MFGSSSSQEVDFEEPPGGIGFHINTETGRNI